MAAERGAKALLRRGDGGDPEAFTLIGGMQNVDIQFDGNPIDVTTSDDVDGNNEIWQTFITGVKTMSVSGTFIPKDLVGGQALYNDFSTGAIVNYEVVSPNLGTWTVAMIVSGFPITNSYDGVSSVQVTLQASGAPTFVAET